MRKITFFLPLVLLLFVPSRALGQEPPRLFSEVVDRADLTPAQQSRLASLAPQVKEGTLRIVRVDPNAPLGDSLRLDIGGDESVLKTQSMERRSEREFSWSGADRPPQEPGALSGTRAVLVSRNGDMFGTVHDGATVLELRPLGNGLHAFFERDFSKLPPEHPNETGEHPSFRKETPPAPQGDAAPPGSAADAVPCGPIDVIVAYTAAVAQRVGDPGLLVALAEKETNTSYANSGIKTRIRVVHAYQTSYVETGSVATDLAAFHNQGDGDMDEVHALRDAHVADLALLLVDSGDACGYAADIYADAADGFAIVRADCATGYYSFGHEMGHLQGARHNPEVDWTNTPFPYCHGFLDPVRKVRTVMAYDCPGGGCKRVDYWAGPGVLYQGHAMGVAGTHEDARLLDETSCRVTSFRLPPVAPQPAAAAAGPPCTCPDAPPCPPTSNR